MMLDALGRKDAKPWQDRKNYRLAASRVGSKCRLWNDGKEAETVRVAVWNEKRKPLRRNQTLLPCCGREDCVTFTHLKAVTDKQKRQIAELRSKRCSAEEVQELASELRWSETEVAAVLGRRKAATL